MNQRPNYYMLLGLAPTVEDSATIAQAIQDKKSQWAIEKNKLGGEQLAEATLNLDRLPDIHAIMSNPQARREEADGARRLAKEERIAGLKLLDNMVAVLRAGGVCTSDDITTLVKDLGGRFSQAEVADRVRAAGLSIDIIGAASPRPVEDKPLLSSDRMLQLRTNLKIIGVRTLYEFLERDPNSSARSLFERAGERDQELFKIGIDSTDSRAAKALYAQCNLIFCSEDEKRKYNNSLAIEAMAGMERRVDLAGRRKKFLSAKQLDELVKQARESGVAADDARAFVVKLAAKRKWDVEQVEKLPSEGLRQCGHCSTLAKTANAEHCGKCGRPLTIDCPRCESVMPTEFSACTGCGFPIGDWNWIKIEVDKASLLASQHRIDEAASLLRTLGKNWPGWKAVEKQLATVELLAKERQSSLARLEALARERRLLECESEILRFSRAWPETDLSKLISLVADGITKAKQEFEQGLRLQSAGKIEGAIDRFRSALLACVDYREARNALAGIPPSAPENLTVVRQGVNFQLHWTATDKASNDYIVVKNARASPVHSEDGVRCFVTNDTVGTDSKVQEGVPWHYAVFSRRDDVVSKRAARSGPHLRTSGIEELHVIPADCEVEIRWRPPNGCLKVEVWRGDGVAPSRSGVGKKISGSINSIHDVGLSNDVTYGYLFLPIFADPIIPNAIVMGPTSTCVVTPTSPPKQVVDLRSQRDGDTLRLRWTDPGPGTQVQIRQIKSLSEVVVGSILSKEDADQIGVPISSIGPGLAQTRATEIAEMYFVPFSLKASTAVVGQPISVVLIRGPQNLKADTDGRDIRLTWDWPDGALRAAVCYCYDEFPKALQGPDVIRKDVELEEYKRSGLFTLKKAERRRHYISVFVTTRDGRLSSEPANVVAAMGQEREFTYRIVRPRKLFGIRWGNRSTPELLISGHGKLPETVLVAKARVVPLNSDDGRKIVQLPALSVEGQYSVPIDDALDGPNWKAKLFFKNPRDVQEIRLNLSP